MIAKGFSPPPRNGVKILRASLYPYQCHIATVLAPPPTLPARRIQGHQGHPRRPGPRGPEDRAAAATARTGLTARGPDSYQS